MGMGKKHTVGYAYFMGLHMVIAKSADALLAIRAGGRTAWKGERFTAPAGTENGHFRPPFWGSRRGWPENNAYVGPVTENTQLIIDAPGLFGGDTREGGLAGALDVMFGRPGQVANDYLEAVLGAAQPAYLGVFSCVFRGGMVGAMNPYLKDWSWRIRRNLTGWEGGTAWYPEKCQINVGTGANGQPVLCMNPAHILYQVLTDTDDGMGYPAGILDAATFTDAANVFHAEGLGLFLKWMQSTTIEEFSQAVLDHCNAMLVENPKTGKIQLLPMRHDYIDSELLTLTPDNSVLESFERATLEETVNEVTVTWDDTFSGEEGSVTLQNLAHIDAMGGVVSQTKAYAGAPTQAIAQRLGQRDLDVASALLARCRIKANRIARDVTPGRVIALEGFTRLGLGRVIIRVLRVRYGGPDGQEISIEGAEDVFGLPLNSYVGTQPGGWIPEDTAPLPVPSQDVFEVPFRDLVQVQGIATALALPPSSGYVAMVAQRPSGLSMAFKLLTKQGSAAYVEAGEGAFTPTATLADAATKTTTVLALQSLVAWSSVDLGTVLFLGDNPDAEAVKVTALAGTTATVLRGCLDTVPKAWPIGTRVWGYDDASTMDANEYVAGEVIQAKALTVTGSGVLPEASAPADSLTMRQRAARPYPPGRVRINDQAWPATSYSRLALSWYHRDRALQADSVLGTEEYGVGPEPGTTYTVRVYQEPGTLLHTQAGITATGYTWDAILANDATLRVELEAVRDGLVSWQTHKHVISAQSGDQVVNGNMDSDTAWVKGDGWTIAGGKAVKAPGVISRLEQDTTLVAGKRYRVEFTISDRTAGSLRPRFEGTGDTYGSQRSANGTFEEPIIAVNGNTRLVLYADAAFDGKVDGVRLHRLT